MLFHRSGFNYINNKKSNADKIIKGYKNYCADLIESTYLSYRIRNRLKPIRDLISNKKKIILKYALAYRTRLILRSSSIQNILVEIANLKSAINSKDSTNDNLNEQFKQRLDRLYLNFIDEYNCLKSNKSWVDQAKTENFWLLKYLSLIYVNNPKYNIDNQVRKSKDNYIKSKSKGFFNNDIIENNNMNNNNFNSYDERPIKPMKLTGFNMEDAYPKEGEEIPKKRIVRNKKNVTNNNNLNNNNNENVNNENINNENLNNENIENNQNENLNENPYNNYDERPIGSKNINYEEMFGNANENFDEQDPNKFTKKQVKKKIPNNRNVNKKPKYDARKAIEEAKQKELKEGKKEKKSSFREFIREMKKIAKEEKESKKNLDSQMSNFGNSQSLIKDSNKNNTTTNINISNINETSDKKNKKDNNNNNKNEVKEERQSRKNQPIEIELRKKLHDLERSPPPKLNIKNAKSKINCWTNNDKNTVNIRTFSKGKNKINNQKNEWKKIITDKQNLKKIENEFNKMSNTFNIENFFKEKEEQMKEFDQIPFIKKKQNYIESLTDEAYNQLLIQLNNKYKDLNE